MASQLGSFELARHSLLLSYPAFKFYTLATSVVPRKWKKPCILPIAKIAAPSTPADYRPISVLLFPEFSNVLSSGSMYIYIYIIVHLVHTITAVFENNPLVVVLALDFSKAFDSV